MQTTDECELSHGSLNKRQNWRETAKEQEGLGKKGGLYSKKLPERQKAASEREQGQMKREMKGGR